MGENIIEKGRGGKGKKGKKGGGGGEGGGGKEEEEVFGLTEDDLKKLKRCGRIACFERGEMICCQGVQVIAFFIYY